MRRRARIDSNQSDIVDALRKAGASVQSLAAIGDGAPDLLAGFRQQTFLLECKDGRLPLSHRQLTDAQVKWHIEWRGGPCVVVNSVDEALAAIGAI